MKRLFVKSDYVLNYRETDFPQGMIPCGLMGKGKRFDRQANIRRLYQLAGIRQSIEG